MAAISIGAFLDAQWPEVDFAKRRDYDNNILLWNAEEWDISSPCGLSCVCISSVAKRLQEELEEYWGKPDAKNVHPDFLKMIDSIAMAVLDTCLLICFG